MKLKRFLIIYAVVTFSWGIAWLLLPSQLFIVYRLQETTSLKYTGQLLGAFLIGLAMIHGQLKTLPVPRFCAPFSEQSLLPKHYALSYY